MVAAGAFDAATADDAMAIGKQDDLEQHGRREGAGAGVVVSIAGVEARQVKFVVDQVVEGMLETAGDELTFEIDGKGNNRGQTTIVLTAMIR